MVKKIVLMIFFVILFKIAYAMHIEPPNDRQLKNFEEIKKFITDKWQEDYFMGQNTVSQQKIDGINLIRIEQIEAGEVYLVIINFTTLFFIENKLAEGGLQIQKILFLYKDDKMIDWNDMPAEWMRVFTPEELRQMFKMI